MPLYEFRCPICDDTFEVRRPMAEASDPVTCPQGHDGARRLLSVFASVGSAAQRLEPRAVACPVGRGLLRRHVRLLTPPRLSPRRPGGTGPRSAAAGRR